MCQWHRPPCWYRHLAFIINPYNISEKVNISIAAHGVIFLNNAFCSFIDIITSF